MLVLQQALLLQIKPKVACGELSNHFKIKSSFLFAEKGKKYD
jgi:hypothetical protein